MKITSAQNERIKAIQRLRKPRERKKTNRFLIEGYREITRALLGNFSIELLYFSPTLFLRKENEETLMQQVVQKNGQLIELPASLFHKLSYRDRPDGLLAIGIQKQPKLEEIVLSQTPFLLVAESIEKPGNLGTILRSCDAVGTDAVIVSDPCTDMYNPNVVRSSVGSLFTQLVLQETREKTAEYLEKKGITKVAATPDAKQLFTAVDFSGPIAIFVGSEQYGLQENSLAQADIHVRIPMLGKADSLNVAQATTVLLYEVIRQRHLIS